MPSPLPRLIPRNQKSVLIISSFLLLLLVLASVFVVYRRQPVVKEINSTQLRVLGETNAASSLKVDDETLIVTGRDGSISQAIVTNAATQNEIIGVFIKNNLPVEFSSLKPGAFSTMMTWMIPFLTFAVLGFVVWRVYAHVGGGRGGDFNPVDQSGKQSVNFAHVAGVDEAKAELAETIEFLRDPTRFGRLGGRAPRGILLSGPPGTGKTLLARAAATEAGVPVLSVSGSSFQEKFAGLGAARVRKLFKQARELAPCVVFIDEIDALGRRRGRGGDSASADQDQTLNQLLVEMDGFSQTHGVVVIAST